MPASSSPPPTMPPHGATSVVLTPPRRSVLPWVAAAGLAFLVWYFRDIVALFAGAFAIAYVFEPVVSRIHRLGVPRVVAVIVVLLSTGVALTALLSVVIPDIVREVTDLSTALPGRIRDQWLPDINHALVVLRRRYHIHIPTTTDAWLSQLGMRASEIAPRSLNALLSAASATISVVEFVLEGVIALALSFYLLMDYQRLTEGVISLVPLRARGRFVIVARQVDATMGRFVRGQIAAMIVLGSLYSAGLTALGIPAGMGIGVFAGMISFVPYVGFLIALALALLLATLDGGGNSHVVIVAGFMAVVHILDNTVITPRILGGSIGLSPVVVILSLLAGAKLAGLAGLLVAIPVAAILRVILAEVIDVYRHSGFYNLPQTAGALPVDDPPAADPPIRPSLLPFKPSEHP